MKIQNALVSNLLDRSQRYFAHVTTVTLSWRVQNIVVIGHVYFTLECFEFSSNFEFDRNMLSGTGARCYQAYILFIVAEYSTYPMLSMRFMFCHVLLWLATDLLYPHLYQYECDIFWVVWDEMNNISHTTFSNVFSSMKRFELRLKFYSSLFLRVQLTIFQHWFGWWLSTDVINHLLSIGYKKVLEICTLKTYVSTASHLFIHFRGHVGCRNFVFQPSFCCIVFIRGICM